MKITFEEQGDFASSYAAETWCRGHGFSIGSSCAGSPRCLMLGDYEIAKWRNLTPKEKLQSHGLIEGDLRNGPITVTIKPWVWEQALQQLGLL